MRSRFRRLIQRAFHRLDEWLTEVRVVHGLPVHVRMTRINVENEAVFKKVEAALNLIAEYQPWRLSRMQRDVKRISVHLFPICRAAYLERSHTLLLDTYFVATFPEEEVASSIIHEASHARIRSSVSDRWTWNLAREERLCRKAQLYFGRALPDPLGAAIMEYATEALALPDEDVAPDVDWNEPYLRDTLQMIEEMPAPEWLKRWLTTKAEQRYPLRKESSRLTTG